MPLVKLDHSFLDVAITDNDCFGDAPARRAGSSENSVSSKGKTSSVGSNSKGDATAWRKKVGDNNNNNKKKKQRNRSQKYTVSDDDQSVTTMATASGYSIHSVPVVNSNSMPHRRSRTMFDDDCKSVLSDNRRSPDLTGSVLDFSSGNNNKTTIKETEHCNNEQEEGSQYQQDHLLPEEQKDFLLQMETLKMSFAEAQSQMDWYKLRYRHLHNEFTDLQAFCKQLQAENIELRTENESLKGKVSQKHEPWFKMERFAKLNRPKQLEPGDDWDDTTIATQRTFTTRSSQDKSYHNATPLFDKPNDIIVTTKTNNNIQSNENPRKSLTPVNSSTHLPLQEEEEKADKDDASVNTANASLEDEQSNINVDNESFLVPSEVDAEKPASEENNPTFIKKHRFLPKRGSLLGNIAENIADRRGSMSSIFGGSDVKDEEMKEMNLDDSTKLDNGSFHVNDDSERSFSTLNQPDCTNIAPKIKEESNSTGSDKDVATVEKEVEKRSSNRWKFPWERSNKNDDAKKSKTDEVIEPSPAKVEQEGEELGGECDDSADSGRDDVFDLPNIPKDTGYCDDTKSHSTSSSSLDMPQDLSEDQVM